MARPTLKLLDEPGREEKRLQLVLFRSSEETRLSIFQAGKML